MPQGKTLRLSVASAALVWLCALDGLRTAAAAVTDAEVIRWTFGDLPPMGGLDVNHDGDVTVADLIALAMAAVPTIVLPTGTATSTPIPTGTSTLTPTATATVTLAPTSTLGSAPTPTASSTPTTAAGGDLGSRTFTLGAGSGYFSSFFATSAIGNPKGSMVLNASSPDAGGHAAVTVSGPFYVTIAIRLGGLTNCIAIDSCTGDLYCNGGTNVDVTEKLNSLKAGLTCIQDGTNYCPNSPDSVCCSNACEGSGVGSGSPIVSAAGVNPGADSGKGAMLLTCMQRVVGVNSASGVNCAVQDYSMVTSSPQIYTTGSNTALVLNHCAGTTPGNDFSAIPEIAESGQNFDCTNWTAAAGAGAFAFSEPTEEPSSQVVGDGAQAGILSGH